MNIFALPSQPIQQQPAKGQKLKARGFALNDLLPIHLSHRLEQPVLIINNMKD